VAMFLLSEGAITTLPASLWLRLGGAATTSLAAVPSELQRSVAAVNNLGHSDYATFSGGTANSASGMGSFIGGGGTDGINGALVWLGEYLGE